MDFEEQSNYYLNPVEALRVSAVLESALEKLELLSVLSQDISQSDLTSELSKNEEESDNPTTVGNILKEQKILGIEYEKLLAKRGNDLEITIEEKEERESRISDLHRKLKENTKLLCRNLKETPNEISNWKKIKTERNELSKVLKKCKEELITGILKSGREYEELDEEYPDQLDGTELFKMKNKINYNDFLKKINKEEINKKFLDDIITREKKTNKEVKKLRELVDFERKEKEKEVILKTSKITKLMNQLRQLKTEKEENNQKYLSNRESKFECNRRLEKTDIQKMDEEWRRLKIDLTIEKRVFNETKEFLDFKNQELSEESKKWSEKFEKDQEEMQAKVQMWKSKREDQIKIKEELEKEYKKEKIEQQLREEDEEKIKLENQLEKINKLHESATTIKLAWKCYKDRELFQQIKNQKKKKKKKKKKK